MRTYEIEKMEGLYVVFKKSRMYSAHETLKGAKEAIEKDKAKKKKAKSNNK